MEKESKLVERVKKIIGSQISVEESKLDLSSRPSKFGTWDSLANTMIYLEITNCIEEGLSFEQYLECKNIEELVKAIQNISNQSSTTDELT